LGQASFISRGKFFTLPALFLPVLHTSSWAQCFMPCWYIITRSPLLTKDIVRGNGVILAGAWRFLRISQPHVKPRVCKAKSSADRLTAGICLWLDILVHVCRCGDTVSHDSLIMAFPAKLVAASGLVRFWSSADRIPTSVWISIFAIFPITFNTFNVRRYHASRRPLQRC